MQKYINYKNVCLTKDKKFFQNVGYKVFEINSLLNYLINMSIIQLKIQEYSYLLILLVLVY